MGCIFRFVTSQDPRYALIGDCSSSVERSSITRSTTEVCWLYYYVSCVTFDSQQNTDFCKILNIYT